MAAPTPEVLVDMAIGRFFGRRNDGGAWLAMQLRDNQYSRVDAETVMMRYAATVAADGNHAYTEADAMATLKSAYRGKAREPWKGEQEPGAVSAKQRRIAAAERKLSGNQRSALEPSEDTIRRFNKAKRRIRALAGSPAEAYLVSRGISTELAGASRCRHAESWGKIGAAAVFPVSDSGGIAVAAAGRAIGAGAADGTTKQTFGPRSLGVFSTPGALTANPVAITEAPIDALSLAMAGLPSIALCGCPGKQSGIPSWLITRLAKPTEEGLSRTVFLAFDADVAGDDAAAGAVAQLALVRTVRLRPPAKDWNDVLRADPEGFAELIAGRIGGAPTVILPAVNDGNTFGGKDPLSQSPPYNCGRCRQPVILRLDDTGEMWRYSCGCGNKAKVKVKDYAKLRAYDINYRR